MKDIRPAVLVVGGWFDAEDLAGTLKTFRAIEQQSPATKDHLVMGPWVHGGWLWGPGERLGDISFGSSTAEFFRTEIELPFFRHYLKDAADPESPLAYVFETGKNTWHKEDEWPPKGATPRKFYLHAAGKMSESAPTETESFDEYVSDPANPVPFFSKPTLEMAQTYMDADQRFVRVRSDVLTYESDVLSEDLNMAGPISPTIYVSTSGTDSDFVVKVIDAYPAMPGQVWSGYQQLVRGEPFRGKFRHSFEHPEAFQPGKVEAIHFTMPDVYHCFQRGHRIVVQVQSSWFPLVDRNPQTFTDIPTAKPADFVKATERIYHSKAAASFVEVEVAP